MKHFKAVGLMSGTSLDGLDIALCEFTEMDDKWTYKLITGSTISYPPHLASQLSQAHQLLAHQLAELDESLGVFFAEEVNKMLKEHSFYPDLIASHGHTVFHQPKLGITLQIGNAQRIADMTGILTVADFRRKNVEMGGQGAPLVPIGDKLLFTDYRFCLNLGGIANISFEKNAQRIAFDCCPFNQVLNLLAQREGKAYDENGAMAASGKLIPNLLAEWNALPYYQLSGPRSLGREWVEKEFILVMDKYSEATTQDLLATAAEHFAEIIGKAIQQETISNKEKVLVTGGGAFNEYFVQVLKKELSGSASVVVADNQLISFKEALVFAFLGVLRKENRINILSSVTGAPTDHSGGEVFQKFSS